MQYEPPGHPQAGPLPPGPPRPFQPALVGRPPSREEKRIMKLSPAQWNQLMCVGPRGSSLFQKLVAPFKTNPNVSIQLQTEELAIYFVGVREAVSSAYQHVQDGLR